jgi:hypothetical protein
MSKHRVLSFKLQLRLEWRDQDGQNETEQPDHSASLSDSITSSTRIRFSVHTAKSLNPRLGAGPARQCQLRDYSRRNWAPRLMSILPLRITGSTLCPKSVDTVEKVENGTASKVRSQPSLTLQRASTPTEMRETRVAPHQRLREPQSPRMSGNSVRPDKDPRVPLERPLR